MIKPGADVQVHRIPLKDLRVHEYQTRYPDRLNHYIGPDPGDPGVICVKPLHDGTFEILDGHHRFCAMVMTGRPEALCLVIDETSTEPNPQRSTP